jgi:uncharacterized protein YggT (Ycf19 family)
MTHDNRQNDPARDHDPRYGDDTRPMDRPRYDDQQGYGSQEQYGSQDQYGSPQGGYVPPPAQYGSQQGGYVPPPAQYVPPPQPSGGQVNVNSGGGGAAYVDRGRSALYYARRVISLLFAILLVLIAIRVILLALAANETNQIVDFVYDITEPFVAPFRGIFSINEVRPGGGEFAFDLAAVVAAVGWLLIYLLLMAVLSLADRDRA